MQTIPITAPPSKSLSHRALICAALAPSQSELTNILDSDDLSRTRECLTALGATFDPSAHGLTVQGITSRDLGDVLVDLFVGESGTVTVRPVPSWMVRFEAAAGQESRVSRSRAAKVRYMDAPW